MRSPNTESLDIYESFKKMYDSHTHKISCYDQHGRRELGRFISLGCDGNLCGRRNYELPRADLVTVDAVFWRLTYVVLYVRVSWYQYLYVTNGNPIFR